MTGLLLRNVEIEGRRGLDVRITGARIAEIGAGLSGREPVIDGGGGALIPGLIDHHIHLLGLAAQADSVVLDAAVDGRDFARLVEIAAADRPTGSWIRATGYHERMAGLLDRDLLDRLAPGHPLRVQHQSGALWVLNSRALDIGLRGGVTDDCVERDAAGEPTGRIWRGDAWLSGRIGRAPPRLNRVGRQLAALGVVGVSDASATTTDATVALIRAASVSGALPQRVRMMSAGALTVPKAGKVGIGPVKVLLDEYALPAFDDMLDRIAQARAWGRRVAVHCVTETELAYTLAAFESAGTLPGDRIEHCGLASPEAAVQLAALGLTVVTQPSFITERGDRYLAETDPADHGHLYPCASLLRAGVKVAASSDAPYAAPDPWATIRAAGGRRTRSGQVIGKSERVSARTALALHLGGFDDPGGAPRRARVGQVADLCLLREPLDAALVACSAEGVMATVIAGQVVHLNSAARSLEVSRG